MKKHTKRVLSLILALVLVISMSGCSFLGAKDAEASEAAGTPEPEGASPTATVDPAAFASGELGASSGEVGSSQESVSTGPSVADELELLSDTADVDAASGTGEMTAVCELLGQTWYVAFGSADDDFTVDGVSVDATAVDADGTIFKWAESDVAGQTVYGSVNVPYADFYYGELNDLAADNATVVSLSAVESDALSEYREDGMFDAVTSATSSKWKQQSGTYTQAAETGNGGQILGVSNFCIAMDADLFVNAVLLSALDIDCGTSLQDFAAGMSLLDEAAAVYKTLYADGTLSAAVGDESTLEASFTVSTKSKYGDYELKAGRISISGTICGVILVTDDGSEYALCHLENIWGNGRELAWYSSETSKGRYLPYEGLEGSTITEIRYITSSGITVCSGLSLEIG